MKARHWEYTFHMYTRNLGDGVRHVKRPFTDEPVEVPIDPGLTGAEWDAVHDILRQDGFEGPLPEGEGYGLFMPDGQRVGIRFNPTGLAVEIVVLELSDGMLNTLIQIARAGNLAFTSATGDDEIRILDGPRSTKELARWPDAKAMHSISEFREWLLKEIRGRRVYVPPSRQRNSPSRGAIQ